MFLSGCRTSEQLDISFSHIKIFSHRGLSNSAPENSLYGFKKAVELGLDGIEFDIRLTLDNEIIICHDEDIRRTTTGAGFIKDLSLQDIQQYDLKHTAGVGVQKIPTLEQVLDMLQGEDIDILIDMKENTPELADRLLELISAKGVTSKVIILSLGYDILKYIHACNPDLRLGYLIWNAPELKYDLVAENYNHIYLFGIDHPSLEKPLYETLRKLNKPLYVYPARNIEELTVTRLPWVNGIISDDPEYWLSKKK